MKVRIGLFFWAKEEKPPRLAAAAPGRFPPVVIHQKPHYNPLLSPSNPCKTIVKPSLVFLTFSGSALSYLPNLMGFTGRGEHKNTAA
jgi:hypothetical protein